MITKLQSTNSECHCPRSASTPATDSTPQYGEGHTEVVLEGEIEQGVDGGVEVGRPVRVLVQVGRDAVSTVGTDWPEDTKRQPAQHEESNDGS